MNHEEDQIEDIDGLLHERFRVVVQEENEVNVGILDTFRKTKRMIRDLGLDYKKIDVSPNDCMIYWKYRENDTSCHVCGALRWNEDVKGDDKVEKYHKSHKVSSNVLRHFPIDY